MLGKKKPSSGTPDTKTRSIYYTSKKLQSVKNGNLQFAAVFTVFTVFYLLGEAVDNGVKLHQ